MISTGPSTFGAQGKICDGHDVRLYLSFYVQTFWTRISDSVCKGIKTPHGINILQYGSIHINTNNKNLDYHSTTPRNQFLS